MARTLFWRLAICSIFRQYLKRQQNIYGMTHPLLINIQMSFVKVKFAKCFNLAISPNISLANISSCTVYIFIYIFIYIYIYIFQAVRRAVNEMFETPDTVFNNLELLVNPSSTAKKCSATEDCCRNPGGDRHPSSTVKYCSATGLLPNRQRGERPGVNGLPFSHRRKETPVFNKLQLLVNRRLRQNRRKRNKPVFNS